MKRYLTILLLFTILLVGCSTDNESGVLKNIEKKIKDSKGYHLTGTLEMIRNEDSYLYDVDVSYEYDDKFKVSLINQSNKHNQIILKNEDGVFVLTPSLNKSFKFQSDWPYNNSQSYLLQTLLKDLQNSDGREFKKNDKGYEFIVKANYPNDLRLVKQHIFVDKNYNIYEVQIVDSNDIMQMRMTFNDIDYKSTFDDNYFNLDSNIETKEIEDKKTSVELDDIIYPMYVPANTALTGQDIVDTDNGKRVILTFDGDKPFMLIQENVTVSKEFETVPVYGEPFQVLDTIGALTDTSVNWVSNDVEYYLISDSLSHDELISVASSISLLPAGK